MKLTTRCILLFFLFFLGLESAYAKKLPIITEKQNMDSMQVDSMIYVSNDLITKGTFPTNGTWRNNLCYKSAFGRVILGVKDNPNICPPSVFDLKVRVRVTYLSSGDSIRVLDTTLSVSYKNMSGGIYKEKDIFVLPFFAHSMGVEILSIDKPWLRQFVYLEAQIEEDRTYCNLNSSDIPKISAINYLSGTDEIEVVIDSTYLGKAEYFDLEWTFEEGYSSSNPSTILPTNQINYSFKNNATRVQLVGNKFRISNIFENGYLIFRVRLWGYTSSNISQLICSDWSTSEKGLLSVISTTPIAPYKAIYPAGSIIPHEQDLAWQLKVTYAEEGKKKEVISYFDGALKPRQTVTRNSSDYTVLVSEVIFDHLGREAIKPLPVPAFGQAIAYYHQFNTNFDGDNYTFEDFELTSTCTNTIQPMDSASGASLYYSSENPNLTLTGFGFEEKRSGFIPRAFGYPFTQTEFMPDQSGRTRRQSGVGLHHKLGSGHETFYYYGTPNQEELDRLFGNDVGFASHYKKNLVIDPNGQASVSYLNSSGKVIATGLAGQTPSNTDSLNSNLLTQDNIVKLNQPEDTLITKDGIILNKYILVEDNGSPYRFKYSLNPADYQPTCNSSGICYDCVYDFKFTITDECGNLVLNITRTLGDTNNPNLTCITNDTFSFGTDPGLETTAGYLNVTLNRGVYHLSKSLTVNKEALDYYLEDVLQNRKCKSYDDFLAEAYQSLDTLSCFQNCDSCNSYLGTKTNYVNQQCSLLYAANGPLSSTDSNNIRLEYDQKKIMCDQMCAQEPSICETYLELLKMDVRPGGQYLAFGVNSSGEYVAVSASTGTTYNFFNDARTPYTSGFGQTVKNHSYFTSHGRTINGTYKSFASMNINELVMYWEDTLTNILVTLHPEYCKYIECDQNETGGEFYNKLMATNTYSDAESFGYISGSSEDYGLLNADPFFADGNAGFPINSVFLERLRAYKFLEPGDPISLSMHELAIISLFCSEATTKTEMEDCLENHNDLSNECVEVKDAFWNIYKSLYLSLRLKVVDSLAGTEIYNGFGCDGSQINQSAYKVRFPNIINYPGVNRDPYDIGNFNNFKDQYNGMWEDQCMEQCSSYIGMWRQDLQNCGLTTSEMDSIISKLLQVCKNGCDSNNTFGASTVSDANMSNSSIPLKSFRDVLENGLKSPSKNVYVEGLCDDVLIRMPKPYGHNIMGPLSPQSDTCDCAKIKNLCQDSSTSNCPCEGQLTGITDPTTRQLIQSLKKAETDEATCKECINCFKFRQVFLQFDSIYYNFYDSPFVNLEAVFTNFLNIKTGLNLSFVEYINFGRDCNNIGDGRWQTLFNDYKNPVFKEEPIFGGITSTDIDTCGCELLFNYYSSFKNFEIYSPGYYPTFYAFLDSIDAFSGSPFELNAVFNSCIGTGVNYIDSMLINDEYSYVFPTPNWSAASGVSGKTYKQLLDSISSPLFNSFNLSEFTCPPPPDTRYLIDTCGCDKIISAKREFDGNNNGYPDFATYFADFYNNGVNIPSFDSVWLHCMTGLFFNPDDNIAIDINATIPSYWAPGQWQFGPALGEELSYLQSHSRYIHLIGRRVAVSTDLTDINNCDFSKICKKLCNRPINEFPITVIDPCTDRIKRLATQRAGYLYQQYLDSIENTFREKYIYHCIRSVQEVFEMKYPIRQYHYTLYYYDQAGNLVQTVPPSGVAPLDYSQITTSKEKRTTGVLTGLVTPSHTFKTQYTYSSLNAPIWQITPDAGHSRFYYDELARLVFSQNAKQKVNEKYSYTKYDNLGRIVEVGEVPKYSTLDTSETFVSTGFMTTWLNVSTRTQITETVYDQSGPGYISPFVQNNLRTRVSYSLSRKYVGAVPESGIYYNYDIAGNVISILREFPELEGLAQDLKVTRYEFDLVSGKVNGVFYQENSPDQYMHQYQYDAENRITGVYSGPTKHSLDLDAHYYYYMHGPLSRTELGYHQVQGLDYTYTIQGWMKGINGSSINRYRDMGNDGARLVSYAGNADFAEDVASYTLRYFADDYSAIGNTIPSGGVEASVPYTGAMTKAASLYNGNISMMQVAISVFGNAPMAYGYRYDQLNRLAEMNAFTDFDSTGFSWNAVTNAPVAYRNKFKYDANGNILNQIRYGNQTQVNLDSLEYEYYSGTNRLKRVLDPVASGNYSDDIDNQSTSENYKYDEIGNLTRDVAEEIDTIFWNVYGKISKIKRTPSSTKSDLEFYYTPDGHRSVKIVIPKATPHLKLYTYYSRDAQGNILAVYNRTINKIINYDNLTFAGVNDSLYKITGTAAFGGFIASLFPNNSDLAYYLADCALDSSRIDDVLNNLNLTSYCLLTGRLDSVCNNIDNNDLAIAGINYLNENSETASFLNTLCDNSNDFTSYLGSLEFEKYVRALSSRDVSNFIMLYEALSLNSFTDNEVAINWFITNSSWGAVKTWLDLNWHNYNECSEKTNIIILTENYTDYLQNYLVNNGPLNLLRLTLDDEQLLNALISGVPSLNSIILETFNHTTLANWYQINEKNNFNTVVAKLMPSRVGPWQTINSTDTMETYFAQISSYFGQSVHDQLVSKFYNASSYFVDSLNATEWHIYGSSRLGIYQKLVNMAWIQFQATISGGQFQSITGATLNTTETDYSFNPIVRGSKHYEISNHLGNVLAVVSDMKLFTCHQYDKFVSFEESPNIDGIWSSRDAWQGQNAVIALSNGKLHIEENITSDPHVRVNYLTAQHLPPNQTYKISFDLERITGDHDWQIGIVCANTDSTYESSFTFFSGSSGHNEITVRPTGHIWRVRLLHLPTAQDMEYYLDNFRIENLSLDSNLIAKADVISANDYYPFGAPMSQRTFNSSQYRFAFNGKEKIDEINGGGNDYDYGARIYDARLGRWLSVDPLQIKYPNFSPYNYSLNSTIMLGDPDGNRVEVKTTRYRMINGEKVKISAFKAIFVKADIIERTIIIHNAKLIDLTGTMSQTDLTKEADLIEKEISRRWSTINNGYADNNGYITNDKGQKVYTNTYFKNPVKIAYDQSEIKFGDHVFAIVNDGDKRLDGVAAGTAVLNSGIMYINLQEKGALTGKLYTHESGHWGGLDDVKLMTKENDKDINEVMNWYNLPSNQKGPTPQEITKFFSKGGTPGVNRGSTDGAGVDLSISKQKKK